MENLRTDPTFNIALDEYVVRHFDPSQSYFYLWRNGPSVIVGRNQNTVEEVNVPYVESKGIKVVRRMSGGGAVYHDLGNLNFSFVVPTPSEPRADTYARLTEPVLATLRRLGVNAERSGRNDLTIDGKKFCGNAVYVAGGRMLHHGAILYDADLDEVQQALSVAKDKVESHGVKSVRSRVTNVREHMPGHPPWETFATVLTEEVGRYSDGLSSIHRLTPEEEAAVTKLQAEKYSTWEWNYGESPPFTLRARRRFPSGTLDLRLSVKDGRIASVKVYGDFFGTLDVSAWEQALVGVPFDRSELGRLLESQPVDDYFWGLTGGDILSLLFDPTPSDAAA